MCHQFGMTEQQFWTSNPRIIKIYEKAWQDELNRKNQLIHLWVGSYGMSALTTSLSVVLQPMFCKGKHSNAKYIDEPVRIFPKTEEEKKAEYEKMTQAFVAWGNMFINQNKKPDS